MPSKSWFRPKLTVGGCRPSGGKALVGRAQVSHALQFALELEGRPNRAWTSRLGGDDLLQWTHFEMTEQASSPQREGSSVVVKVLYIEDNDDDVYMLKMRLELLGNFEVLTAADGEKGCEVAAAEQPDIILMDLEMPVVDGWEAARRL